MLDMNKHMSAKVQSRDDRRVSHRLISQNMHNKLVGVLQTGLYTLNPLKEVGLKVSMNSSGGRAHLIPRLQVLLFSVFSLLALWLQLYLLQPPSLMDPAGHMQR